MKDETLDATMPLLLLYVLDAKYRPFFEARGNREFLLELGEMVDELAFDCIGDMFASDAERALGNDHEIGLIDASDFAEDVIRILPPERPAVGRAHKVLGFVRVKQGNLEAAIDHFAKAVPIFKRWKMVEQLREMEAGLQEVTSGAYFVQMVQPIIHRCQHALRNLHT